MYTVYKHLDNEENIIYIGKSKSLLHRQRQHSKNAEWFDEIDSIEYCVLDSKIEMDIVELYLITYGFNQFFRLSLTFTLILYISQITIIWCIESVNV